MKNRKRLSKEKWKVIIVLGALVIFVSALLAISYFKGQDQLNNFNENIDSIITKSNNSMELSDLEIEDFPTSWKNTPYKPKIPEKMSKNIKKMEKENLDKLAYKIDENLIFNIIKKEDGLYLSLENNNGFRQYLLQDWSFYKTLDGYVLVTKEQYSPMRTNGTYSLVTFDNNGTFLSKDEVFIDLLGSGISKNDDIQVYVLERCNATLVKNGNKFVILRKGIQISEAKLPKDLDYFNPYTNYYISNKHILYYCLLDRSDYDHIYLKFLRVSDGILKETNNNFEENKSKYNSWKVFHNKDGKYVAYSMDEELWLNNAFSFNYNTAFSSYKTKVEKNNWKIEEHILDEPQKFTLKYNSNINEIGITTKNWTVTFKYKDGTITDILKGLSGDIEIPENEIKLYSDKEYDIKEFDNVLNGLCKMYKNHIHKYYNGYLKK